MAKIAHGRKCLFGLQFERVYHHGRHGSSRWEHLTIASMKQRGVQGFKTSKPTFSDTLLPPRPHILTLLAGPPTGDQIHKCLDAVGGRSFKPPSWSTGRCDEFSETQKQCFTQDLVRVFTFSCFSFKFIQHKATSPPSLWWPTLSRSTGASELEFHSSVSRSLSFSVSTQGHSAPSVGAHSSPLF